MTVYSVAIGHNVAVELVEPIVPQPRTVGRLTGLRTFAANGAVHDQAIFVELVWDVIDGEVQYQDLLEQFGLDTATTANVTLIARDATYGWMRYNGVAVRPEIGRDGAWERFFLRDVRIVVNRLAELGAVTDE